MASSLLNRSAVLAALTMGATVAAMAAVVVTSGTASAAGAPCQRTFASGPVIVAIPDNDPSGVSSAPIDVPEDGLVVSDIDVSLNISHTSDGDLAVELDSETDAGDTRAYTNLIAGAGFGGDNFIGTTLDDQAAAPIGWGTAPFTGRFSPTTPLSLLKGATGGRYRLFLFDRTAVDTGNLTGWSVTLSYASCDFDSDGVEDHADSCLQISAHTSTGCPVTTRSVTAKYKLGKFKGVLSSPVIGCKASRAVTIWKVRSGADKNVGTATTSTDGSYKLKRVKHVGRYYATSARLAVTDVAECPAATSPTFRIR
jgi:subtilisin-like proprotein convertase family protein